MLQVVAVVGPNGQHSQGINIAFDYVIPLGFPGWRSLVHEVVSLALDTLS